MLEFDDIQYILLTRVPALTGRYEFLSFRQPAQGRAWLKAIREKVPSAKAAAGTVNIEKTMGFRGVHLERIACTRGGRSVTRDISRGISARHGGPVAGPR